MSVYHRHADLSDTQATALPTSSYPLIREEPPMTTRQQFKRERALSRFGAHARRVYHQDQIERRSLELWSPEARAALAEALTRRGHQGSRARSAPASESVWEPLPAKKNTAQILDLPLRRCALGGPIIDVV